MTLLGKIFTGLILVMSVMFMSFAIVVYATHVNWKERVKDPTNGLEVTLRNVQDKVAQLQLEIEQSKNTLAAEQAARRAVLASLRTKLDEINKELVDKVREYDTLLATKANLSQTLETNSQTLLALQGEVATIRKSIIDTIDSRNTVFEEFVALTDTKNRLEGARDILSERHDALLADVTKAQGHLARFGVRLGDDLPTDAPQRKGFVTKVGSGRLIEISLGDDDGMRTGHELYVYRGATFLGKAVIRETSADFAVAEIVQEVNKSVLIRKGDRVSTKLG
ncbi:MAG: hypothetical protein KDB14_18560 [Planctomycetales bacterium]|nr:hypothetical protein [Planctomycetales bacterium]